MKIKNFILFALPCIFWWGFVLYLVFGNFDVGADNKNDILCEVIKIIRSIDLGTVIIGGIQLIIFFPITVLGIIVIWGSALIVIPVLMFINGFYFNNLILWLSSIIFLINFIAAFKFKLGKFQEDSSYVSGYHYKVEEDHYGDLKVTKENEYSGGGEWVINILLFCFRLVLIAVGGVVIYIIMLVKSHKKSKKEISKNVNEISNDKTI